MVRFFFHYDPVFSSFLLSSVSYQFELWISCIARVSQGGAYFCGYEVFEVFVICVFESVNMAGKCANRLLAPSGAPEVFKQMKV